MTYDLENIVYSQLNIGFRNNIKIISVFGYKVSEVLIVNKEDVVFGFGQNDCGVLGFGHNREVKELTIVEELCGKGIIRFVNGCSHVMGLTIDGKLYSWGRNNCSQLGNGLRDNEFNKPLINEYLINEIIVDISCGAFHTIILTKKRELYVWGCNKCGQIGNESEELFQSIPFKLNAFNEEKVLKISCGFYHSLVLTDNGHVFSWGNNYSGQLGLDEDENSYNMFRTIKSVLKRNKPKLVLVKSNNKSDVIIDNICCGPSHNILLSIDGDIYTFGDNLFGQIGNNSTNNQIIAQKIISSVKYKYIASHFRYDISIAHSVNDILYIWGKCGEKVFKTPKISQLKSIDDIFLTYNRINFNSTQISSDFKRKITYSHKHNNKRLKIVILDKSKNHLIDYSLLFSKEIFSKFRNNIKINPNFKENIKNSFYFYDCDNQWPYERLGRNAFFLTEDNTVYSYGSNNNRLIRFNNENEISEPLVINELSQKGIIDFASGVNYMIARTHDNKLYIWGNNYWGQLGNGTDIDRFEPQLIDKLKDESIVNMCCGPWHSLALTECGQVYAWGDNEFGQIGNESDNSSESTPYKIFKFKDKKIIAISSGTTHCLALTESGVIYSWGRNNCGQLGFINIIGSNKPKRLKIMNKIELFFTQISCGLDYSLILTSDGDIYGFGCNNFGQLGNELFENHFKPTKIMSKNKFIDIASHYDSYTSVALSSDGIYYIWGYCGQQIITEPKPTKFDSFNKIFLNYNEISFRQTQTDKKYGKNYTNQQNFYYSRNFQEFGLIAFGSFGIVSKAKNKNENEICAIKIIGINDKNKDSFHREYEILSQLKSEFVVNIKSFWIEPNYLLTEGFEKYKNCGFKHSSCNPLFDAKNDYLLHIQMEMCFKSLKEIKEQINKECKVIPFKSIKYFILSQLLIEIIESVDYLHKRNPQIIHRDLKPANILITHGIDGRFVKLCDFGLAKVHENEGQSHTKCVGTLKYMATEVSNGDKYDTKSDIYSLGIIIRELFKSFKEQSVALNEKKIIEKFKNLWKLKKSMVKEQEYRPNCELILYERNSWALSISDVGNESQSQEWSDRSFSIEENFCKFFYKKKLEISKQYKNH